MNYINLGLVRDCLDLGNCKVQKKTYLGAFFLQYLSMPFFKYKIAWRRVPLFNSRSEADVWKKSFKMSSQAQKLRELQWHTKRAAWKPGWTSKTFNCRSALINPRGSWDETAISNCFKASMIPQNLATISPKTRWFHVKSSKLLNGDENQA